MLGKIGKKISNGLLGGVSKVLDEVITNKEELAMAKVKIQEVENDLTKAYLEDIDSAREMNTKIQETANASWLSKNINPMLAIAALTLGFGLFYIAVFRPIDVANEKLMFYLLGVISSVIGQVLQYYFGSSMGSKNKETQIDKLLNR